MSESHSTSPLLERATEDPICLVFASNEHYAPGLFVAIGSTLDAYRGNHPIEVHVLDTGLSAKSKTKLKQMANLFAVQLTIHVPDLNVFSSLSEDYGGGFSTYARLLVGRFLDVSRFIYIDTDVLVLKDVASIVDMDMGDNILMATRDRAGGDNIPNVLARDCPFESNTEYENIPYFNMGFILVDLAKWKREGFERKCLDLLAGFHGRLKAWDQTILNYVCRKRIGELPHSWLSEMGTEPGVPLTERNYHFIGKRKPWMRPGFSPFRRFWSLYYRSRIRKLFAFRKSLRNRLSTGLWLVRSAFYLFLPGFVAEGIKRAMGRPSAECRRARRDVKIVRDFVFRRESMKEFRIAYRTLSRRWRAMSALREQSFQAPIKNHSDQN